MVLEVVFRFRYIIYGFDYELYRRFVFREGFYFLKVGDKERDLVVGGDFRSRWFGICVVAGFFFVRRSRRVFYFSALLW